MKRKVRRHYQKERGRDNLNRKKTFQTSPVGGGDGRTNKKSGVPFRSKGKSTTTNKGREESLKKGKDLCGDVPQNQKAGTE